MTTLAEVWATLQSQRLLLDDEDARPTAEIPLRDITVDSRRAAAGVLFCAIRGTRADGHRFLEAAAAAGAAAALVEEPMPEAELPQIRVSDTRIATAHAAAAVLGAPWRKMSLIGVTGTNGKTTTAAMLRHLLGLRAPAASVGTLGAVGPDGAVLEGTEGLTTPGPIEVARVFSRLAEAGVSAVAMEASSHALEQQRLAALSFDAAIFTNLSRDHLDYHPTMEAYRDAKLRLAELLKPGGTAVVNADDAAWRHIGQRVDRAVTFGLDSAAQVRAEALSPAPAGVRWTLRTPDCVAAVELPLLGSFNVSNALGAAAALWSMGWETEAIAEGLGSLPQIPGRLERVPTGSEHGLVIIDFAHTPDALARVLEVLRPFTRGELRVMFGAGGDRDPGKRPEMGRVAASGADFSIITSDNPRTEWPESIIDDIERGMGGAPRRRIPDRREAIAYGLSITRPGDVLLLAGKGHERYQICGDETVPFDEREIVTKLIEQEPDS